MTKPIFKTRCERFLRELNSLYNKYDVSCGNGGVRDGATAGEFVMTTPKPKSDGNNEWFVVHFKEETK